MKMEIKKPKRCGWCTGDELYEKYHDEEWGKPVMDDAKLFEFLTLETFQAGLSWVTILHKRENFRRALDNFDYRKIAKYGHTKIKALLQDSGIVRHQLKIKATITNAIAFMGIQHEYGSFSKYIWGFVDGKPIVNRFEDYRNVPANTELSDKISKDLKKRGFKFVGSTIVYSLMQAAGMVNDHEISCFKYNQVAKIKR